MQGAPKTAVILFAWKNSVGVGKGADVGNGGGLMVYGLGCGPLICTWYNTNATSRAHARGHTHHGTAANDQKPRVCASSRRSLLLVQGARPQLCGRGPKRNREILETCNRGLVSARKRKIYTLHSKSWSLLGTSSGHRHLRRPA